VVPDSNGEIRQNPRAMKHLVTIARRATPSADVQYRRAAYGSADLRLLLRDVIALANTDTVGPRYIVIGMDFDDDGRRQLHPVPQKTFRPTLPMGRWFLISSNRA